MIQSTSAPTGRAGGWHHWWWCLRLAVILAASLWPGVFAAGQTPGAVTGPATAAETVALPPAVPDPLEPINRAVWAFNRGLMTGVIKPTSRIYRFVVVKPAREGIRNFGKNLTYPGRLINNLLQGKWTGARDETYRFLANSTAGIGGFVDVADRWQIPRSEADFGQTFGQWGWRPHFYLMLPLFGPSNERDALGLAADTAANPLIYISPYDFEGKDPLTYLGPYTYFSYGVTYNNLSDSVDEYVRFSQGEADAYAGLQYAWSFARENRAADFQMQGEPDAPSLESMGALFLTFKDPEFPNRGRTRDVLIPATGRKLKFTFWLRPGKAPVVYLTPGLGSHRLARPALALAELAYRHGYSVVSVSSTYNSEFMENASTAAMPAYLPVDGHDLHAALTEVDRRLQESYPDRLGEKALMGYSMGALQSLFLAASAPTNPLPLIKFDRYVALHSPVRLLHGVARLDEFYQAPLAWPAVERAGHLENTLLKVAALSQGPRGTNTSLPFNASESRFLVGLNFRFLLRDIIFSSQTRTNLGILQNPLSQWRRVPVYQEILGYSYQDYFEKFAVPYYQSRGLGVPVAASLEKAGDLRTYETALRSNASVRVIVNQNDFLLTDEDLAWLRATFPPAQLTVFPRGGHLGNFSDPPVQNAILEALQGLQPAPAARETK